MCNHLLFYLHLNYPSKLIEDAVVEISRLPGIGKKSALRIALHLLKQNDSMVQILAKSIVQMKQLSVNCSICNNITDAPICYICSGNMRNKALLCIVEDTKDVLAIENTGQYNGLYFVLGGVISPVNGIGPSDLNFDKLLSKFPNTEIVEIILALSPTIDGDTTSYFISKKLKQFNLKITTIARGIQVGSDLEYVDEVTLGRSIHKRIDFDNFSN